MNKTFVLGVEILKSLLKPGYLYCKGKDGQIYCVEADMPEPGGTIVLPPLHLPKEGDT